MVDPNDQSILYTVSEGPAEPWVIYKWTNHGAARTELTAFGQCSRAVVSKVGTAATLCAAAHTQLKVSVDGGGVVSNVTVDGNIAGGGMPLNWNWSHLMAFHTNLNGANGTRYFQLSPDGGITWYNKHGNMTENSRGLVSVGFSLEN